MEDQITSGCGVKPRSQRWKGEREGNPNAGGNAVNVQRVVRYIQTVSTKIDQEGKAERRNEEPKRMGGPATQKRGKQSVEKGQIG